MLRSNVRNYLVGLNLTELLIFRASSDCVGYIDEFLYDYWEDFDAEDNE